jgi:leucyl-tRNA synthetase
MYGQTNCFVLPEGDYGAYEMIDGSVFIISERAARGLAHQGLLRFTTYIHSHNEMMGRAGQTPVWGVSEAIIEVKGQDLLGLALKAPNAQYEVVYTLPLLSISMGKGTGVVTSVPSDAPDDYAGVTTNSLFARAILIQIQMK